MAGRADRDALQPGRVVVLAVLAVLHGGVVVQLSRPVSIEPPVGPLSPVVRIQLVDVSPPPAPPALVRPPARATNRPSPVDAGPQASPALVLPALPADAGESSEEAVAGEAAGTEGLEPATAPATFSRPSANGRPLRNPQRPRLPGREEAFVQGIHVRSPPSIEDRVVFIGTWLLGGGRPETCDDVRQRLIGAAPGLARDMDVESLRRVCTD